MDFAVWSRGDRVELCLAEESGSSTTESRHPMRRRTDGVWTTHLPWVRAGDRYGFRVHGPWDPVHGHRFDPGELLVDPYARAIDRQWSVVVDGGFDWGPDAPPRVPWPTPWSTSCTCAGSPSSTLRSRPSCAAPTPASHTRTRSVTSLDLGVTTLELLPVHQFAQRAGPAARGRANYWGYNTLGFFAPHAGYAAGGSRGEQVHEFKAMVRVAARGRPRGRARRRLQPHLRGRRRRADDLLARPGQRGLLPAAPRRRRSRT